jgi:transcriptional regulator with XRE-family HTH domain
VRRKLAAAAAPDPQASNTPAPGMQAPNTQAIGSVLARHRRENAWTLAEVSRRTGVSISALSKIENGRSRPAYDVLTRLAGGLDLDLGELLGGERQPRFGGAVRSISRAGQGSTFMADMGRYEVLANELAAKSMTPMVIEIPRPSPNRPHARSAHLGEEFAYVLEGVVIFSMEPYAPVRLETGDSVYFDGSADHRFYSAGDGPSRILSIVLSGKTPATEAGS